MDIILYNKNLVVLGVLEEYEGLVWTSNMFEHGEFSLKTSMYDVFNETPQAGGVTFIGRSDSTEVCLIEGFNFDGVYIEVFGRNATSMLGSRLITTGLEIKTSTNVGSLVDQMRSNATADYETWTNRELPQWSFANLSNAGLPTVSAWKRQYKPLDTCIYDSLKGLGIGLRAYVKNVTGTNYLDLALYEPTASTAVFGTELGDVVDFQRSVNYADFCERVIARGTLTTGAKAFDDTSVETRNLSTLVYPKYKELFVSTDTEQGTMSLTEFNTSLRQKGREALFPLGTDSLTVTVDESRLTYGVDYSIGNIVRAVVGTTEVYDLISSVTETFEKGGRTLDLGIGETAPTLKRYLKRLEN